MFFLSSVESAGQVARKRGDPPALKFFIGANKNGLQKPRYGGLDDF
jgi:hypothetical protein